jgi:guanylate kinase
MRVGMRSARACADAVARARSFRNQVGKDAVVHALQQRRPDTHFVVTATTRAQRPGETHGRDYLFVSQEAFAGMIAAGELLEHALVYGEYKGIPKAQVRDALASGRDVVLRLDVQGAATVRRLLPGAVAVFLVAESEAALVGRLVARQTEGAAALLLRVRTAREETRRLAEFDYCVVNAQGRLEAAVDDLCAVIDAEKLKVARAPLQL